MIAIQLKGGLSNQLFQYATARRLANLRGAELGLDVSWFDNIAAEDTSRHYELDCFKVAGKSLQHKDLVISGVPMGKKERLKNVFRKTSRSKLTLFEEKNFRFDKSVLSLPDDTYLVGYFQSEKYFVDIRDILLRDLTYKQQPSTNNQKLLNQIQATNAVSVHVRRGDYVNNPNANQFHGLVELDYYKKAADIIKRAVQDPVFYVISNDPQWCKEHLELPGDMVYVDNNDDFSQGSEDMRLMRACKHNIMANSSFSWWGAWLNENPDKIVIAPKKWFNDKSVDTSDLVPTSWQRI